MGVGAGGRLWGRGVFSLPLQGGVGRGGAALGFVPPAGVGGRAGGRCWGLPPAFSPNAAVLEVQRLWGNSKMRSQSPLCLLFLLQTSPQLSLKPPHAGLGIKVCESNSSRGVPGLCLAAPHSSPAKPRFSLSKAEIPPFAASGDFPSSTSRIRVGQPRAGVTAPMGTASGVCLPQQVQDKMGSKASEPSSHFVLLLHMV